MDAMAAETVTLNVEAAAMAGDEHARGMYRFVYGGVADEW